MRVEERVAQLEAENTALREQVRQMQGRLAELEVEPLRVPLLHQIGAASPNQVLEQRVGVETLLS